VADYGTVVLVVLLVLLVLLEPGIGPLGGPPPPPPPGPGRQPAPVGASTQVLPPCRAALMPPWRTMSATDSSSTAIATIKA
jgi:hypothetical protein